MECWGDDDGGRTKVPDGKFRAVATGLEHTCAVLQEGGLRCFGGNGSGQATAPEGSFVDVAAGWLHTCAIGSSGRLQCWGYDFNGESKPAPEVSLLELPDGPKKKGAVEELNARASNGERVVAIGDALFIDYPEGAGRSKLSPALFDRLVGSPVTARNWRTVLKLESML